MTNRRRRFWIGAVVLILMASAGGAWYWSKIPRGPNVILITLDTTRADRLGCYGYKGAKTPFLDSLANEGILFENAVTNVPLTLPSHSTMHTGLLPPEHGLRVNGMGSLPEEIPTLAELFSQKGYRTGAFIGAFVLDKRFGLNRGFQTYDDDLSGGETATEFTWGRRRPAARVIDSALEWLGMKPSRPYFCWIHLYDPHHPCTEHKAEFGNEFAGRGYDAEIAYVDTQLQRLIKTLRERGALKDTCIIVAGDHGESLGEHNEEGHGKQLYQSVLRVPLLVHWPERYPTPRKVGDWVALQEIFPTVTDALKLPVESGSGVPGRSLTGALAGGKLGAVPIYAETWEPYFGMNCAPQQGLIDSGWKYIRSPERELYELTKDADEKLNVFAQKQGQADAMESVLKELEQKLRLQKAGETRKDARLAAALKSMGYSGGQSPDLPPEAELLSLPDVKQIMVPHGRMMSALDHDGHGDPVQAVPILKKITEEFPKYRPAKVYLALMMAETVLNAKESSADRKQKLQEAERLCREVIAAEKDIPPKARTPEAAPGLATILGAQDRFDEADKAFDEAAKQQAANPNAKLFQDWGMLLLRRQRTEEALKKLQLATQLDEGMFTAQWQIGELLLQRARAFQQSGNKAEQQQAGALESEALGRFELATRYNKKFVAAHYQAAAILMSKKQDVAATAHLEAVAKEDPEDANARYLWGLALVNQQKYAEAAEVLRDALKIKSNHTDARDLLRICQEQLKQ